MTHEATNRVRRVLDDGERAITGLMLQQCREDLFVRLVADSGLDLVIIDREHGTYDLQEVARLVHLCRLLDVVPLVRPPDHAYASLSQVLDCGARGILLPRVSSAVDVHSALEAMKYPPRGSRGMASQLGHADYLPIDDRHSFAKWMNDDTMLVVQVELASAVDAVEEILAVPGVDLAMIGPGDLSLSLASTENPTRDLDAAIEHVLAVGESLGVPIGIQTGNLDALQRWRDSGMRLLVVGTEVGLVTRAIQEAGDQLRAIAAGSPTA